ncbi:Platelet-derived growth factor receptor beta, partial [Orchesella cincta]
RTLVLGSGTFGTVYRGSAKRRNKDRETTVAVKTTNSSSPSTAVSGMISEIKVLSHLGEHENIVNLVGAYTKEIRKGKIYLFLEFCSRGSLEKYLREQIITPANQNWNALRRQGSIKHCIQTITNRLECRDELHVDTENNEGQLENLSDMRDSEIAVPSFYKDLYRWSCEIANGMEFLTSKNVCLTNIFN